MSSKKLFVFLFKISRVNLWKRQRLYSGSDSLVELSERTVLMSDPVQGGVGGSTSDSEATRRKSSAVDRDKCLFCRIVDGKEKDSLDKIIYQDDEFVVFPDIKPAAKNHLLVVTKEHIKDAKALTTSQISLLDRLVETGAKVLADKLKKESDSNAQDDATTDTSNSGSPPKVLMGFHWPPFHTISHLHLHVISPSNQIGFIGRILFRPNSYWFVQPEWVKERLEKMRDGNKC